jgi:hypothetical protein
MQNSSKAERQKKNNSKAEKQTSREAKKTEKRLEAKQ